MFYWDPNKESFFQLFFIFFVRIGFVPEKAWPENKKTFQREGFEVVTEGIEPPTQGFSVLCSTN
jgi:hypothetical protein